MPHVVQTVDRSTWTSEAFYLASSHPHTYRTLPHHKLQTLPFLSPDSQTLQDFSSSTACYPHKTEHKKKKSHTPSKSWLRISVLFLFIPVCLYGNVCPRQRLNPASFLRNSASCKTYQIIQLSWWQWCLYVCFNFSPTVEKYSALKVHRK